MRWKHNHSEALFGIAREEGFGNSERQARQPMVPVRDDKLIGRVILHELVHEYPRDDKEC